MTEINYNLSIDSELKKRIEKIADENRRSISGQILTILEEYVEKEERRK